ncbi:MAG: cobyrinate a,c-diamide synthase [Desulfovibrio sp.]|nr:cobyrinate a,c-diamide synthase [Desulfovibrio sp.]
MRTEQKTIPGIVIGGTGSNTGKTTVTLALLCALASRGLAVRAAKTGPDSIDAAFHAAITGQPAANLDTWMCRQLPSNPREKPLTSGNRLPQGLQTVFNRMSDISASTGGARGVPPNMTPDMLLIEGAMGLYDGGHRGAGSTAQLAALLDLPVLLVCSAAGLGQSVAALVEGYLRHKPQWLRAQSPGPRFLGVVCTHVGSQRHAEIITDALKPLEKSDNIPLLALLPRAGAPELQSRHLGLVEAREAMPALDKAALAQWLENNCRLDHLLKLAGVAASPVKGKAGDGRADRGKDVAPVAKDALSARFFPPRQQTATSIRNTATQSVFQAPPAAQASTAHQDTSAAPASPSHPLQQGGLAPKNRQARGKARPLIGMAWDDAFSFCYADLPAMLAELGADLAPFSPLRDDAPPLGCTGLYFPGGYPELHAEELAANTPMLQALRALAHNNLPIYGECGGYIYLMRSLRLEGPSELREYALAGLLPIGCTLGQSRAALGYRAALALPGAAKALWVRGHEFHYAHEDDGPLPPHCSPLWQMHDSKGAFLRDEGCRKGSVAGTWLHCYPEGSRTFWRAWLKTATPWT